MRPSIKFRSRHRVHEANVAADANSVGKVRALRAGQVQTVVTPMIAGSPQACKLFRRCASNAMSRRLLHSLGSNQRRGVTDQDDSHFTVNGNPATMNSTQPAWAARRWRICGCRWRSACGLLQLETSRPRVAQACRSALPAWYWGLVSPQRLHWPRPNPSAELRVWRVGGSPFA